MWLLVNLLIIYMQKFDFLFLFYVSSLPGPAYSDNLVTSTKIGQNFDRWILMAKNAAARN